MTQGARDLAAFKEAHEDLLKLDCRFIGEHRRLATSDDDGVVMIGIQLWYRGRFTYERREIRSRDEASRDQVFRRIPTGIARIAHGVGDTRAAVRTEHPHLITLLREPKIRVRQLTPPKANGPSRRRGNSGIRDYDRDAFPRVGIDNIGIPQAHVNLRCARLIRLTTQAALVTLRSRSSCNRAAILSASRSSLRG
jgi:hypothetical protein